MKPNLTDIKARVTGMTDINLQAKTTKKEIWLRQQYSDDVTFLIGEVERLKGNERRDFKDIQTLKAQVKVLDEALEFYSSEIYHYYGPADQTPEVLQDRGECAITARAEAKRLGGEG
jgi:hypothetical protein